MNRYAIILAAGKGTRMKSDLPKVMHPLKEKPMIEHVVSTVEQLGINKPTVIVGYQKEVVINYLGDRVHYDVQNQQHGTAHAVLQSYENMYQKKGTTIILNGDVPLLSVKTLEACICFHEQNRSLATILTAKVPDPYDYGRILRSKRGTVERIVEEKDATEDEKRIHEINTGIFCFDNEVLFRYLPHIKNDNVQKEYYLTDMIQEIHTQTTYAGEILAYETNQLHEIAGVNSPEQLRELEKRL